MQLWVRYILALTLLGHLPYQVRLKTFSVHVTVLIKSWLTQPTNHSVASDRISQWQSEGDLGNARPAYYRKDAPDQRPVENLVDHD